MYRCTFFFFKQKTAYEMRISDWSSDVCSSDLLAGQRESLIFIEMDRTAARNRAELAIEIEQVLDEVRCAVGGWKPILARLRSDTRSEERRVGKGCVSTCRSRWSQYH